MDRTIAKVEETIGIYQEILRRSLAEAGGPPAETTVAGLRDALERLADVEKILMRGSINERMPGYGQ